MPTNDELWITMGTDNGPYILGLCETSLDQAVNDEQLYTCINEGVFFYFFYFIFFLV